MKEEIITTNEWDLLEKGKNYLRLKNVFKDVEECHRFYNGDQWYGLKSSVQPITYNVIKPIVKYKIGVVNSNGYDIVFSPNNFDNEALQDKMDGLCKKINKYISQTNEMTKIHKKIKKLIKKAAIVSEGIIYFTYDLTKNEVKAELVNKTNIFYANENDDEIQEQPYILITFRRDVDQIREEARGEGISEEDILKIVGDTETYDESGEYARDEVHNKVTVVLKLFKKAGKVYAKKSTKLVNYVKEYDTGLTYYPVEHLVWEDEEGSARGIGVVKPNIPNQIEINQTATRRSVAVKMGAYPKPVVNIDKIVNPSALSEIGTTIKLQDIQETDVKNYIGYLQPATMSSDSEKLQTELITNTRELEGAGDSATGQINPENASGKAILAVQQASQQPLTEQTEKIKDMYEGIGLIIFDMWKTYTPITGKTIVIEDKDVEGNTIKSSEKISREDILKLEPSIKIDITPKTAYDRYAQEMSIENLLANPNFKDDKWMQEYHDLLPDDSVMPKPAIEKLLKNRKQVRDKIIAQQKAINEVNNLIQSRLGSTMGAMQLNTQPNQGVIPNAM